MKIESSFIKQESQHLYRQESVKKESLLAWIGDERPNTERQDGRRGDGLTLSFAAREMAGKAQGHEKMKAPESCAECQDIDVQDAKLEALRRAVEAITGRKIVIRKVRLDVDVELTVAGPDSAQQNQSKQREGWGIEYDYFESYSEEESLTYTASGVIVTEDGREVSFSLDMAMSRSFYESSEIHIREGDAKLVDPLVINFAGKAAELTDAVFTFDLEGDGQEDELHTLASGSAFLALDRNGDGVINDGRELFGPQSGHGFSELAAYDEDNNGWIDENDAVFTELLAWIKDQEGNDQLISVMDLGVGALSLAGLEGNFSLTNTSNEMMGQIRETSIFVKENGEVGTVQELDLVV